jgi:DNA-binding transcriptional ArsR family regulator
MLLLKTVDSAASVAALLADNVTEALTDTEKHIYEVLCSVGLEVMKARGYSERVTEVHFFCPAELVAMSVGIHPSTLYRRLPALREAGLADCRGHYCTHNGVTRSDGSVWAVRLSPNRGCKAKVPFDYLKKQYRCLGQDIESGRTAWQLVRQSKPREKQSRFDLSHILRFALSDSPNSRSLDTRTAQRFDLETVLDLASAPKTEHAEMLLRAAKSVCVALQDNHSERFWYGVLKGLLRLRDSGKGDYFQSIYLLVARCRADVNEGMALKGGALAVSRLKRTQIWDAVMNSPPERITTKPLH